MDNSSTDTPLGAAEGNDQSNDRVGSLLTDEPNISEKSSFIHSLSLDHISDRETFHKVASANDVILVKNEQTGQLFFTDFHVAFERTVKIGSGNKIITANALVHIFLNGLLLKNIYMRIKDGICAFPDGTCHPPEGSMDEMRPVPGVNTLRFEARISGECRVLVGECFLFNFSPSSRLVVVDIDGTITKSDIRGLFFLFSNATGNDYLHPGICTLLHQISEEGAEIVYITSRPVILANKTRTFLLSLKQDGLLLPMGPLITCQEKLTDVVFREVFAKDMHLFKGFVMKGIAKVFERAGRKEKGCVFAAGIGNRHTDAVAYHESGIPNDFIFIIDYAARIQTWNPISGLKNLQAFKDLQSRDLSNDEPHFYNSYNDPKLFSLLKASLDPVAWERRKAWRKAAAAEINSTIDSVANAVTIVKEKFLLHKDKLEIIEEPNNNESDGGKISEANKGCDGDEKSDPM